VPYTVESLTTAIRAGVDPAGVPLDALMPRYALGEADARILVDYLDQLSRRPSPGVTPETLHLATVVAPGVAPLRRRALLDVLEAFVHWRNARTSLERRRDRDYPGAVHNPYRAWALHVWELEGMPESWSAQLAAHLRSEPVFALVSGVSEGTWAPVHEFCEEHEIPCWFPTVDLPPADEAAHYTTYFSKGVLIEAEVLGRRLTESGTARTIQIRREGDTAAKGAARALKAALAGSGIPIEDRALPAIGPAALAGAMSGLGRSDAVVLWLRGAELAELPASPSHGVVAYVSATLAGAEGGAVPEGWRRFVRLLYPFELPGARRAAATRLRAWMESRGLAIVDERLQTEAYLACLLLSEKVDEMLESLFRDHLLEKAEGILGARLTSGIYRRLSLGPGQRFASKGAQLARFAGPTLVGDGDWTVP
jgi:hypothetical protein